MFLESDSLKRRISFQIHVLLRKIIQHLTFQTKHKHIKCILQRNNFSLIEGIKDPE